MLQLSYTLHDHGWAVATIGNGDCAVEVSVSHLSDALGDLARAARGILRGLPEATFSFQQEPGEYRLIVVREDDRVRISVFRFPDTFSRKQAGELLLEAECGVHDFATQCINCLRQILDEYGEEGYRRRWKSAEFPLQEYRDLIELRRQIPASRPAN